MGIFGKSPDEKPAAVPVVPAASAPRPASPAPSPAPAPSAPAARGAVPAPAVNTVCVIGPKTTVKGEITGDEDVVVEGTVEGEIKISRDLRVGPNGVVKATIQAQSIVVSGEIGGDCTATTKVEIQSTGRLVGNIRAPRIMIAEGAMFRGNSDMSAPGRDRAHPTPPSSVPEDKKAVVS
jgi:cytoskeletal protein CcmA (bactofilin family)